AIAKGLRELRDPASGRQIVAAVHRREELHAGPHIERVPDLVVEFADYEWLGKGNLKSRTEGIWDKVEISGTNAAYLGSPRWPVRVDRGHRSHDPVPARRADPREHGRAADRRGHRSGAAREPPAGVRRRRRRAVRWRARLRRRRGR